jgi:DNA-binding beta-propeller fold protein YncE
MRSLILLTLIFISQTCILAAEKAVLVAGGGLGEDGTPAVNAKVVQPFAVDFAADGTIFFVEMNGGERLRKIDAEGNIHTLAGSGKKGDSGDNGVAAQATFNGMHNLAVATDGSIYLADTFNNRIRKYDAAKKSIVAFAGTGKKGYAGDNGPALKAEYNQVICIALSRDNMSLYIADIGNRRVRVIDIKSGNVSTFAGNGAKGEPKNGEVAKDQPLQDPRAVAVDSKGKVYILERGGHVLRVVDNEGKIRTVAGTGKAGKGGDGGPALKAAMNGPKFLFCDTDDSVLIADTENHQIRRYVPGKELMELVAGSGTKGKGGIDGDPLKLELARPHGVSRHPKTGELYIADSDNGRVVKIAK